MLAKPLLKICWHVARGDFMKCCNFLEKGKSIKCILLQADEVIVQKQYLESPDTKHEGEHI